MIRILCDEQVSLAREAFEVPGLTTVDLLPAEAITRATFSLGAHAMRMRIGPYLRIAG